MAIRLEIFDRDAELVLGDLGDPPWLRGLGDFNIGERLLML